MPSNTPVALVTGSSRGIGRAIALAFAASGYDLVINHRAVGGTSEVKAEEVCALVRERGRRAVRMAADIAERDEVKRLFAGAAETFGRVDALILNAARAPFKPLERLLEREVEQLVATNFAGHLRCVREALPLLEAAGGGSVVFISSLGSRFYSPSYPLGLMKAAMEAAVRHWAESLAPRHIRVNAVCGGIVRTDSFKTLRQVWDGLDRIPDAWCVEPEEIADVVLFLCSGAARGMRGQTLVVDRGVANRLAF